MVENVSDRRFFRRSSPADCVMRRCTTVCWMPSDLVLSGVTWRQ